MASISTSTPTNHSHAQPSIKFIQQFKYGSSDSEQSLPIAKIKPILASAKPEDYVLIHGQQFVLKTEHIDFIDNKYDFKQLTRKIRYVVGKQKMSRFISENQLRTKSYRINQEMELGYSWNSSYRKNNRLVCVDCKRRCQTQNQCRKYKFIRKEQIKYRNIQCFACYRKGHIAKICPYAKRLAMSDEKGRNLASNMDDFIEY